MQGVENRACTHEAIGSFCCPQHGSPHEELICHPDRKQGYYAMLLSVFWEKQYKEEMKATYHFYMHGSIKQELSIEHS